jgi:DNA topoisomerase-1
MKPEKESTEKVDVRTEAFKRWFGQSKVVDDYDDPKETHKFREVFHGTQAQFEAFTKKKFGEGGGAVVGKGFYFSEDPVIAKTWTNTSFGEVSNPKPRIVKAFLRIEKPFDFDSKLSKDDASKLIKAFKEQYTKEHPYTREKDVDDKFKLLDKYLQTRVDLKGDPFTKQQAWGVIKNGHSFGAADVHISGTYEVNEVIQKAGWDGITHYSRDKFGGPSSPNRPDTREYGRVWIAFEPTQVKSSQRNRGTFDPNDPNIYNTTWVGLDIYQAAKLLRNVFCKTGKGGGIDPTCSTGGLKAMGRATKSSSHATGPSGGRQARIRALRASMVKATRNEKTKRWELEDGTEAPEHVQKAGIPPGAWVTVKVNLDPSATHIAVGRDSKGRAQWRYSDSFKAKKAAAKFGRTRELRKKFHRISAEVERDSMNPALKENADCLRLVMQTGMRPGSAKETGADFKSYGATTLKGRHVKFKTNGEVYLRFPTGKNKGRKVSFQIKDQQTAAMLKQRAAAAGADGPLFATNGSSLLSYSQSKDGGGFKVKDFRTALATEKATELVRKMRVPVTKKLYKQAVKKVATAISDRLGNTPAMALKAYIDPTVFLKWRERVDL